MDTRTLVTLIALAASALVASPATLGQVVPPPPDPAAVGAPPADPWPREITISHAVVLIYQPQVNSWTGNVLNFRTAVALKPAGARTETFGVIAGTARTEVDRGARLVNLDDFALTEIKFPTLPDNGQSYLPDLKAAFPGALATISLNRLEASLGASQTVKPQAAQVSNAPPNILVSYGPALLVPIDGKPVIKEVPNSRFERVINTQALIARTRFGSTYYLHVYDGWLSSESLTGPWTQAFRAPFGLDGTAKQLAKDGKVDLLDGGPGATPKPSLANGVPAIYVTETPSELIIFKGQPNFVPVTGTNLLWASNTAGDVFINTLNNDYYVLVAGRWYRGPGLGGPWTYVSAKTLPADFARIPKDGPAGVVLASVAGTPQAQEALIANSIPQDATVSRTNGPKFTPSFDGPPEWSAIPDTPMQYVINSRVPVIEVNPSSFYAVTGGVWFTAGALTGPWVVATSVPPVIYTIPPASPLHYVTYVRVYGYTPQVVYVGYTPGYFGTVVAPDGVVVYGTGYTYTPWIGSVWYPPPVTYGVAAAPVYNPAVGFTFGFAMGLATAAIAEPYWGGAYYHPYYGGYPCCGSASANVYRSGAYGVSSGTRTWYSNAGGSYGTYGSGTYSTYRGTSGSYAAQRSYNPYTGQASQGYTRTATTPSGASGSVSRGETYNTQTGQRTYASSGSATGAGGSSVTRNVQATAGPQGYSHGSSATTYNARTGQTKTWSDGVPQNTHYAGADGNAYKSTASGWQQHTSSGGWQSASGSSSWADKEQQARSTGESRESSFGSGSGGWDRSGSGSSSWSSRFGGSGGGDWGSHSGGGGFGGGSWGSKFSSSSFGDRFGGGGGFGGGRFGGFRR